MDMLESKYMRIGIFDSGLGGLIIAKAIQKAMPQYDYVYLGDTKRVPYGNRSHKTVFEFTKQAVDYLFKKENCGIIIVACNTVSAQSLKKIQQEYLPKNFPDRKVLGVLIPTAEECAKYKRIGILGTSGTISSNSFPKEIKKILVRRSFSEGGNKAIKVFQNPAPMLVLLAEEGEKVLAKEFIVKYLKPFLNKKLDAVVLGCTHYPFYKNEIRKFLACPPKPWRRRREKIKVISQDEIIPKKLKDYLSRHPEITKKLSQNGKTKILVTDTTENIKKLSKKWFGHAKGRAGKNIKPKLIKF